MKKKIEYLVAALVLGVIAVVIVQVWQDNQRFSAPPLEQAAAQGDVAKVEKLLKAGANVNAHSAHRPPALVAAANKGKTDTVRLLLQYGADRKSRDVALGIAVRHCDLPTVQLLLAGGADGKSLLKPDGTGRSAFAQTKEQVEAVPGPCAAVIRALELSGVTDKP